MAYPQVIANNTSYEISAETTHNISLPAGVSDGDLLIAVLSLDGTDADSTWPVGDWNELIDSVSGSNRLSVAYRNADGGEGSTVDVTTDNSRKSSHITYRITGHDSGTAPEISTGATSVDEYPDPDSLTPTGGPKDFLWIAIFGADNELTVSVYPSNYGNGQSVNSSSASFGCTAGSADREYNGTVEDPGTFTMSASEDWVACTVAAHPSAVTTLEVNIAPDNIDAYTQGIRVI